MGNGSRIKSTETAFEILDEIARSGGMRASKLTEHVGISRTGIYKHLRTLESLGAVSNDDGMFVLGSKFDGFTRGTQLNGLLFVEDTSIIDDLAVTLDAPVNLWSPAGKHCVCVYATLPNEGRENPRRTEGNALLVDSAPGKTMFAHMDERKRETLLKQHDGAQIVEETREQLQVVRERELLIESFATRGDWFSIATPIREPSGTPRGAIEVVIPSERAKGIDVEVNIAGLLLDTANKLEEGLL